MAWQVIHGDCVEAMEAMEADSVDAICTDPPYGLEFMGRDWDKLGAGIEAVSEGMDDSHPFRDGGQRVRYGTSAKAMQEWHQAWATEALRVLKPGGFLLAFGGTRTAHRLACAIEDAGFEIRDRILCLRGGDAVELGAELDWLYGSG